MLIADFMLKKLYTIGSLRETEEGIAFTLKNRVKDALIVELNDMSVNQQAIPLEKIFLEFHPHPKIGAIELKQKNGQDFPFGATVDILIADMQLQNNKNYHIEFNILTEPFAQLHLQFDQQLDTANIPDDLLPRNPKNDLNPEIIRLRQQYVASFSNTTPDKLYDYTIDVPPLEGNIENFTGVAQIPIGIAGPIKVNGEHAKGDFLIPLATTEGTLVASYNRGIKLLNLCGGVTSTIVGEAMQRAPVFVFKSAREARDFSRWIEQNQTQITQQAEKTDPFLKLTYIDQILSNKFVFLRFNYTTGDAAGQNMVGRATFIACSWILESYQGVKNFFLESNVATDKKTSQMNIMRTRGKRVTAEVTIKKQHLLQIMRVHPQDIDFHGRVSAVGSFLAATNNTGLHSANCIAAMFIATGQDVANVSESSAAILYSEVDENGDLYLSVTLPALIVATCGGGTGLGTQKECLEILGCFGANKAHKLAEIIAAVVLAGEISLASAISSLDWVPAHEEYGRNR